MYYKQEIYDFLKENSIWHEITDDELADILGLIPGAVSPFGLLNDAEKKVVFYIDEAFKEASGLIGVHPNDNTATVWLKAEDLIRIIENNGNEVHVVEI